MFHGDGGDFAALKSMFQEVPPIKTASQEFLFDFEQKELVVPISNAEEADFDTEFLGARVASFPSYRRSELSLKAWQRWGSWGQEIFRLAITTTV